MAMETFQIYSLHQFVMSGCDNFYSCIDVLNGMPESGILLQHIAFQRFSEAITVYPRYAL